MRYLRRWIISLAVGLAAAAVITVVAAPGLTTCALAPLLPLDRESERLLFDRAMSAADRAIAASTVRSARLRIAAVFGAPTARPYVIQLAGPNALWPLALSSLASTHFAGTRACVIIGPAGRDVDVTAHELVHAEIFDRIGSWQRRTQLPVWFDEGAAMQVDHRTGFDLPPTTSEATARSIRSASTYRRFFSVGSATLTQHFALAKLEVGRWLARTNPRDLYRRLHELRDGRRFDEIWREPPVTHPPS